MFRDHKVKPSEWKGKQEHEEDILCIALNRTQPMFLATAGFDGDIVLWNAVTEIVSKHLTARKRVTSVKKENVEELKKEVNYTFFAHIIHARCLPFCCLFLFRIHFQV